MGRMYDVSGSGKGQFSICVVMLSNPVLTSRSVREKSLQTRKSTIFSKKVKKGRRVRTMKLFCSYPRGLSSFFFCLKHTNPKDSFLVLCQRLNTWMCIWRCPRSCSNCCCQGRLTSRSPSHPRSSRIIWARSRWSSGLALRRSTFIEVERHNDKRLYPLLVHCPLALYWAASIHYYTQLPAELYNHTSFLSSKPLQKHFFKIVLLSFRHRYISWKKLFFVSVLLKFYFRMSENWVNGSVSLNLRSSYE